MRRLFHAAVNGSGIRLSAGDVRQLCIDDAVRTRINNAAEEEAGTLDRGGELVSSAKPQTWAAFVNNLRSKP